MQHIERTISVGNLEVHIIHDEDAFSPREDDCNGSVMLCWVRDHNIGDDKLDHGFHGDRVSDISESYDSWDEFQRYLESRFRPLAILPVGAETYYSSRVWVKDSNDDEFYGRQVGFIFDHGDDLLNDDLKNLRAELQEHREAMRMAFAEIASIRRDNGDDDNEDDDEGDKEPKKFLEERLFDAVESKREALLAANPAYKEAYERLIECLKGQVEYYSDYLEGNVYMYSVRDENGDILDSCGNYIGNPDKSGVIEEGISSAKWHIENEQKKDRMCEQIMHL